MARHGPARQPSVPPRTLLGVAGAALFLFLLRRPPAAHHDTTAVHPAAVSHYVPLSPLCSLETWLRGWTGRVVFVADHALAFHNGTRATIGVLDQV